MKHYELQSQVTIDLALPKLGCCSHDSSFSFSGSSPCHCVPKLAPLSVLPIFPEMESWRMADVLSAELRAGVDQLRFTVDADRQLVCMETCSVSSQGPGVW